jgi:hypothetical protein
MRLNRLQAILLSRGLAVAMLLTLFGFSGSTILAQSPAPAPELKILSVRVETKDSTQLEIVPISTNNNLRPTEPFVYRPELGNAPMAGGRYEQFERRPTRTLYATIRVINQGARPIKSVDWEYTSPHFEGDKIVIHRQTSSGVRIGSGETAILRKKLSDKYKCRMVSGSIFGQQTLGESCGRKHSRWTGSHVVEARLLKITYQDGTVWKARP